jgi:hypothetical protein
MPTAYDVDKYKQWIENSKKIFKWY